MHYQRTFRLGLLEIRNSCYSWKQVFVILLIHLVVHALETLTDEIYNKAKLHLQEIEELGGMPEAIEQGVPKLRIEEFGGSHLGQ